MCAKRAQNSGQMYSDCKNIPNLATAKAQMKEEVVGLALPRPELANMIIQYQYRDDLYWLKLILKILTHILCTVTKSVTPFTNIIIIDISF